MNRTSMHDCHTRDQLRDIESTLTDTVRLGEAMLTKFAQQSETFERAQHHTTGVVREAQEALHVVRAMQSTPYALWRWCVGWWAWLFGQTDVATNTTPDTSLPLQKETVPEGTGRDAAGNTVPLHVERQIRMLHQQAHAMGHALDQHLHLLDVMDAQTEEGGRRLDRVSSHIP